MIPVLIVPVLTRPELLYRMLRSVDCPVGRLVVVDNGGLVDAAEVRSCVGEWVADVSVLSLPSNLGVASSWNLGVKVTPFAPWWLIVNFDVVWPAGSLAGFVREDSRRALVLSDGVPSFCAFSVGEDVVAAVGLFDESFHPAYLEDTDYQRRCNAASVPIIASGIQVAHDNSSTLLSGFQDANDRTYTLNADYYGRKVADGDLTEGHWSLTRRRELSWD